MREEKKGGERREEQRRESRGKRTKERRTCIRYFTNFTVRDSGRVEYRYVRAWVGAGVGRGRRGYR